MAGDSEKAPKRYGKRVNLDLTEADYEALRQDAFQGRLPIAADHDVTMAMILRALMSAYREDDRLKRKVLQRAQVLQHN